MKCANEISSVQPILGDYRENACEDFKKIFETTEKLSGFPLPVPRKVRRQISRANYETNDVKTYYQQAVAIYVAYADGLIQELNGRFNEHFKTAANRQQVQRNRWITVVWTLTHTPDRSWLSLAEARAWPSSSD